ncbi:hypothetical protein [Acuticoccus sp.]|uniref:hypothetical protein n=1 Tax=Acuticoccus sp. TaxID=1904378 RepID=UPI003B51AA24
MRYATTVAAAITLGALASPAAASEPRIADISGAWSGTGFVQRDAEARPMKVRCAINGDQDGDDLGFEGECRAMLVLKRAIGASIVREGPRYSGTYTGSNAGVAALEGARAEDGSIVLHMTFEREINGDDVALMTITPSDGRTFTITTVDRMEDGVDVTTSQITFERDADVSARDDEAPAAGATVGGDAEAAAPPR